MTAVLDKVVPSPLGEGHPMTSKVIRSCNFLKLKWRGTKEWHFLNQGTLFYEGNQGTLKEARILNKASQEEFST